MVAVTVLGALALGLVTMPGCAWLVAADIKKQVEVDVGLMKATFGAPVFCPTERVLVRPAPQLALETPAPYSHLPPWREPIPPSGVAADPARMSLWTSKRDADHAEWLRQVEANHPTLDPKPIYEVSGCGATRLYTCGNDGAGNRRHTLRACHEVGRTSISPFVDFRHDNRQIVCRNGGILRAQPSLSGEPFTSCAPPNGAEETSVAASVNLPRAEAACESTCPTAASCRLVCNAKPPSERMLCDSDCDADEGRCHLGCATTARRACEERGLAALAICDMFGELERRAQTAESELAAVQIRTHQTAEADAHVREEGVAWGDCRNACTESLQRCRRSGQACDREYDGCLLQCSRTARQHCESFAPKPTEAWCSGFQTSEKSDTRKLTK